MKKRTFLLVMFCALSLSSFAQKKGTIIDEVIWIVGDEAIFRSEVEEQRMYALYEGVTFEKDPYCVIPEQIAVQKLFLHQAALDSITVAESQVMARVEMRVNYLISRIGSKEKAEEYINKSITEYKEELRTVERNNLLIQQMQQKLTGDNKSTPAEVRRYYNNLPPDSIPMVPAQVELQVLSIEPAVSPDEINRVKEQLRSFSDRVNSGEADFSVLARLYSKDTESAKRGGELDFMGRGQLVPEYAAVAFNLQDNNKVSRIVETEFGYHIIQLMEKRGDRIKTRHILLKPAVLLEDKERAIKTVDSIANEIRNEKISFEQAVARFSEDKNTALNAGLMLNENTGSSKFEFQHLPPEMAKVVHDLNVGEISKPFSMINSSNKEIVAIVKLKSKVENHRANLRDDYQLLKSYHENQKNIDFITDWVKKKQKETYISIDPAWSNCEFEYPGWIKK